MSAKSSSGKLAVSSLVGKSLNRTLGRPSARSSGELLESNILLEMESFLVKNGPTINRAQASKIVRGDHMVRTWTLLKKSFWAWANENALEWGAALAYYTAFSIAPLLVIALT